MGALGVTINSFFLAGNLKGRECTITFSASYATNGDTWTPRDFGLEAVQSLDCGNATDGTSVYACAVDLTNKKVLVGRDQTPAAGTPLVQETNTTDLHTFTCHAVAMGY